MSVEPSLSIWCLNEFRVMIASRTIDEAQWPSHKAKSLLKLLALTPEHRVQYVQVMDLLWPRLDPKASATKLCETASAVRFVLEPTLASPNSSSYLHLEDEWLILKPPGPLWSDVEALRRATDRAWRSHDPAVYEEALRLYPPDMLIDDSDEDEDWALAPREELHLLWQRLLVELARLREERGQTKEAMAALWQVVKRNVLHEEAQAALIRLLAQSGRRHLALDQYWHLVEALRRELDVEPDTKTQALYWQILAGT